MDEHRREANDAVLSLVLPFQCSDHSTTKAGVRPTGRDKL